MPTAERPRAIREPSLLVMAAVAALLAQALLFMLLGPAVGEGQLVDIDGYTRLVRVQELHDGGRWYDAVEHRANPPFGVASHWTRPLDAMLLAGAQILAPRLGFEAGLFWWGVLISPCLYVLMALLLVRGTKDLLSRPARVILLLAFPLQLAVLSDSAPGLPDHHSLLLLIQAAAIAATVKMLVTPARRRWALTAGALLAAGVWVSTEFCLFAGLVAAGLALTWLRRGGERARRNADHALGLAAGLVVALAAERPPADWPTVEFDRLSLVHVVLGLVNLAIWTLVARWSARAPRSPRARALALALAALPVAGLIAWIVRGIWFQAEMAGDPLSEAFNKAGTGLKPLWAADLASVGPLLIYLGTALFALPFLLLTGRRRRDEPTADAWAVLDLATLGHLAVALVVSRLAAYAELLLLLPLSALVAQWLTSAGQRRGRGRRVALATFATAAALIGPLAVGAALITWGPPAAVIPARYLPRNLSALYPLLRARPGLGERTLTIVSPPRDAPELLYRTRHRTLAYPQHRGIDGVRACLIVYDTPDEAVAQRILREREVDLVIVPDAASDEGPAAPGAPARRERPFIERAAEGACPDWLRRIPAPEADAAGVTLFAVVR